MKRQAPDQAVRPARNYPDLATYLSSRRVYGSRRRARNQSNLWAARTLCVMRERGLL